jgi:hypothetical protein
MSSRLESQSERPCLDDRYVAEAARFALGTLTTTKPSMHIVQHTKRQAPVGRLLLNLRRGGIRPSRSTAIEAAKYREPKGLVAQSPAISLGLPPDQELLG